MSDLGTQVKCRRAENFPAIPQIRRAVRGADLDLIGALGLTALSGALQLPGQTRIYVTDAKRITTLCAAKIRGD